MIDEPAPSIERSLVPNGSPHHSRRALWPWLALVAVLALAVFQLHHQGRSWWCSCGQINPWSGDIWSSHNSQHLFDPYSFTHVLHGVVLCGLLWWTRFAIGPPWRLCLAISIEALWEVLENSNFTIERYRTLTVAVGYQGDTIANSLGDILSCGIGFLLARRLGLWRSVVFFFATEAVLLIWIRDDLFLNVVMLVYPIDVIRAWQMGY
jgi:hypothetical protein